MDGEELEGIPFVGEYKYLGIMLDSTFNFKSEIEYIQKVVRLKAKNLARIGT